MPHQVRIAAGNFRNYDLRAGTGASAGDFLADPNVWRALADLLLIGVFGGFYIVPLYALIQHRTEARYRSRVIAANNVLNALFMVGAALLALLIAADRTLGRHAVSARRGCEPSELMI